MGKVKRGKAEKRRRWAIEARLGPKSKCPNCRADILPGEGHYAPPSLGEPGFFICNPKHPNREKR